MDVAVLCRFRLIILLCVALVASNDLETPQFEAAFQGLWAFSCLSIGIVEVKVRG